MSKRSPKSICSLSLALGCAAAAMALGSSSARADDVRGSRSELLKEKRHTIALSFSPGHAELRVERTVHNGGPRHDQAVFHIDLPDGSVATALRTLGTLEGKPHWFEGDLMEAEAAAAKYMELTGIGGYYPKDPALLSWRSQNLLALQVFPVGPNEDKTISYTLKLPSSYSDGMHRIRLPMIGTDELSAVMTIRPADLNDTIFVDGKPVSAGKTLVLNGMDGVELALSRKNQPQLDGSLAMVPFGKDRVLTQFRFDAAPRLSKVPAGARVVVIMDASRSLHQHEAQSSVAMARAYVSHFKDAQVEVLTFDRKVQGRHGRFVSVAHALEDLKKLTIEPKNGSRIDDALAKADAMLASLPPETPRRVVVITDARTREELTPEKLKTRFGRSGAIVHAGVVSSLGTPSLGRQDDHPWAPLFRRTGGLVWDAAGSADEGDRETMKQIYEEWARPVRIHKLLLKAPGVESSELPYMEQLPEGQGIEDLRITAKQVPYVELHGELWAAPIQKILVPDEAKGRLWSALVFGSHLLHELSEPEMMILAMRGRTVSPVTSYLAVEPGVRPSTEGFDWSGGGIGSIGFGAGGGRLSGRASSRVNPYDHEGYLRDELSKSLGTCGATGRKATLRVETTLREVVEVRVKLDGGRDEKVESCLSEAAWALDLPERFNFEWQAFDVTIG